MSGGSSSSETVKLGETVVRTIVSMPFPGQSGAPFFDGSKVPQFLDIWEYLTSLCGLTQEQKVQYLVHYVDESLCCTICNLEGYAECDWKQLRGSMMEEFPGLVLHEGIVFISNCLLPSCTVRRGYGFI